MMMTPDELRHQAAESERRAEESFARSDTDGFLSQWASHMTAAKLRREAEVMEAGGKAEKMGLFDADGNRVKAKLIETRYGTRWALLDEAGQIVDWVNPQWSAHDPDNLSPRSKMAKLRLHEAFELAPVRVAIAANGTGLSGAASAHVTTYRTDDGYPPDARPWVTA